MRLQVLLSSTRRALFAALLVAVASGHANVTPSKQAEAAKANNLGTALMNQQLLEKAAAKFADAYQLDPALVHAEVNRGIALVYLQKMPEAEQALKQAAAQDPKDPHIWYALGILYRIGAQYPEALESFQKVAALDPDDADTHYFLGSVLLELRQPEQALTEFQTAQPHACIGAVWPGQSFAAAGQAGGGGSGFPSLRNAEPGEDRRPAGAHLRR
jgi:tetratricopeptide (TPR) repeat protein